MNESSGFKRFVFFILGSLSLVMSYVGVALPGVPGIPFILLTAYFYVRSSTKMYNWLLNHRLFGRLLSDFSKHKTVPLRFKIFVISQLWVSILVASIWFITSPYTQAIVIVSGLLSSFLVWKMKSTSI